MLDKVATCEECNKIYIKMKSELCNECDQEREAKFQKVRTFINKTMNFSATMGEVVEGTGVEQNLIIKWIKEGRLRMTHMKNFHYPCESCGEPTKSGRICPSCSKNFLEAIKEDNPRNQHIKTYNHAIGGRW